MLYCGAGRIDVACDMISFLVLLLREEQKIRIKKREKIGPQDAQLWVAFSYHIRNQGAWILCDLLHTLFEKKRWEATEKAPVAFVLIVY